MTSSNPLRAWLNLALWKKIVIAMILGVIVGLFMGEDALWLKPIGDLFVSTIKMLIVPLVFCSLIVGVTSMKDSTAMGRISIKSIILYLGTTAIAITIGLAMGHLFQPGAAMNLTANAAADAKEAPSLIATFLNLVPKNPVNALAEGNILQIIVFALFLGISLALIGEKGKPAIAVFDSLAEAMYKLTAIVMSFAPYGVFALIAWVAGTYGVKTLGNLAWVILAVYVGCLLHIYLFYGALVKFLGRLSPIRFFKGIRNAQAIAYTTSSSAGTLPASMSAAQNHLGVSKGISSFVLPLGATINMDGTALYQGVCALFVAQAFGIDLSSGDYVTIIITATLASIGTAGVPGAGLIMLSLILSTVGLPMEGIAIIAGIDRILDMARTTVNISGDLMVTTLVAKSEGQLDESIYNDPNTQEPTVS
ncbi:Na+/H+-dicarboxylate symporter [Sinobacterium caligoides]|uniref:Na+/H+-dicarboxylate symporter n=1 Tax=Sinobacterium caligoides TaxID=933926 RepID=A0A3N2DYD8_9GAMM|nr:dicarboxylate/amino acid:cation symporter [Sinobacterium caligoides]ROS04863.1 Na+/H+-dicarboxylate symporter [Sinobacterium caligoides]